MKFRLLVVPLAVAIMCVGFLQLRSMPVDVLPEFTPVSVEIQTEALGLSAAEVEQLVTVPMEQDLLNGVAWLAQIRSESVAGLSAIELIFQPGTDILQARQMVQERLAQAHALPHVSKPPQMIQPLSSTSRVMMVGLSSQDVSLIEMSVLARWQIRPRLMGVPGVANVAIWGQRERQLQVQVDPERLSRLGVSLNQVISTTGNAMWSSPLSFVEASTPGTGGFIDTPNQRLPIRHVLPIRTPQDLAQVPVEGTAARPQRLGDVATVVEDHQPLIGDAVVNNGPGLMLVIEKSPEANTLEVTRGVEDALEALRPGLADIEVDSQVFRPASFIEAAARSLTTTLVVSLILLVIFLGLFFFNWRTALISVVTIPVAIGAALLVLQLRGSTLNVMVVAGLVLALLAIIDSAVIDVDNIRRRLREHREGGGDAGSTAGVILRASMEVRGPLVYGTLITIVATVPLFFVPGLAGSFSGPLALTYVLAVLAAVVVALVVTPALALALLAKAPLGRAAAPGVDGLRRRYSTGLSNVLPRPQTLFAVAAAAVLLGLVAVPVLAQRRTDLVPPLADRNLLIHWDAAPGTSRAEMVRVMTEAGAELRTISGVANVGAHVGRAITSDQVVGINSGELWVRLADNADYADTTAEVQRVVDDFPGFQGDVRTYPEQRLRDVQTGSGRPIVVRIFGEDLNVLRQKADEVRELIAEIDGVSGPTVDTYEDEPTAEIEVDLVKAQQHGLKPGDVRRAAATLVSGLEVGSLFEEQKVFEVVVWGAPSVRSSLSSLEQLLIDTPDGKQVRLRDVATIRVAPNPSIITHDGVSRRMDVTADVSGRGLDAVATDIRAALRGVDFPLEYHAELLDDSAELAADRQLAWTVGIAVAVAILLLLQAAFGTWRLAFAFFIALPVALSGGVLGALVGGGSLSLATFAGLLAVLGLAARGGILLIRHNQVLEREEGEPFGPGLVVRGAAERSGAIVVPAVAAALALLPIVLLGGGPGHEVIRPMAAVMLGGLVTSTLLNLLIVPALYLRFGAGRPERDAEVGEEIEEPAEEQGELAAQGAAR